MIERAGKYETLIFDIDDTIVRMGTHIVDEPVKDAFEWLASRDIPVIAATGRNTKAALSVFDQLTLRHECGVNNGAKIISPLNGQAILEVQIAEETIGTIRSIVPSSMLMWKENDGDPRKHIKTVAEQDNSPASSLFLKSVSRTIVDEVIEQVVEVPGVVVYKARAWQGKEDEHDISIYHAKATKSAAIEYIFAQHKDDGWDLGKAVYVGDALNDIDAMRRVIEAGGLGVAVGNAEDGLKKVAQRVVGPQKNNGILEVIDLFR